MRPGGRGLRQGEERNLRARWKLAAGVGCVSLLWGMAGCRHNPPPPPPATATAPPAQPSSITHVAPLPPVPQPDTPKVGAPGSDKKAQTVEAPPPPQKPRKAKKHATDSVAATTAAPPAASTAANPGGTPAAPEPSLGQLSAGNGADSKERAAMIEEIRTQEARLSGIKRPLSAEGEAVVVQIRAFLAKARQATSDNDLDGARTLTTKAKVLLDELASS